MTSRRQARGELRERFYRSVAETLSLLHTAPGYDRQLALAEVARILAATMDLPLVWIGRREPGQAALDVLAAAGPEAAYAANLKISADEREPGGDGPMASVLRAGKARAVTIEALEFAPWREAARQHGLGSCIAATATIRDNGQLTLAAYARVGAPLLSDELLDWAQRLADELARFWDHQALLERNLRMNRYRDAQRTIQRALLDQPDPAAVYRTLAAALADIAGAAAVEVFAAEGTCDLLQRMALVGPMAEAMQLLPMPTRHSDGPVIFTPTLAFMQGTPVVRVHPAAHAEAAPAWKLEPLAQIGAVGCWPLFAAADAAGAVRVASGVFAVVTTEADAFDAEMCLLLDEIADAAGLALRQHQQRSALLQKQELQTYLALHDALTDVPNRRALDQHLASVLARAEQHGRIVAIGLLDLDDLKPINDRHGHAAGDQILVEVAARLRGALRAEDYVARLGGDEFVLVFEDLEREQDLDLLLARVWQALQQPLFIDGVTFQLSASLGVALYPIHAQANGEQLLRCADQAMYQVKARKRQRDRWWALPARPADADASVGHDGRGPPPYGELAAELLGPWFIALEAQLPRMAEGYYAELQAHDGLASLLVALPPADVATVKQRLCWHLSLLLRPDLDSATHQTAAMQAGFFHAACGVEEVWLLEAIEALRDIFVTTLGSGIHRDHRPLAIVLQRLALDRQWQLASMRETQRRRVALLARLNALAWSADGYLELIQGAVDALMAHEEIIACAVGRPDATGRLTYEAVAGEAFADYLRALGRGETSPIGVQGGSAEGGGPTGRAWRTATIQRCAHYGSDPAMLNWREIAARVGIVSNVAVPLCPLPRTPAAVLTIYSAYAGGFQSEDQQAFVEQIKTVLDLALARLAPPRPGTELLPFFVRERWRAMIATDAVQMHYQPVVRLADGRVTELEALARLRDDDGSILPPARFLPALGDADLIVLFRQGLRQATACRQALLRAGYALDVSVNAPAAALTDPRYAETAAAVLTNNACPAEALLFEILESPIGTEHTAPAGMAGMQALKALGVRLVEDDLGAGYSTLIRLRQWPFDRVKIDQAIVRQIGDDPLPTLRFIRQLIRLGHDLGLEVVVEGLETLGSVEAALILGADLGQGYVLARPMPGDALAGWLAGFEAAWDATRPVTAVGVLAGVLLWEEQFLALPSGPSAWAAHAALSCAADGYLHLDGQTPTALHSSHVEMHAAAIGGPRDPAYRQARETFLAPLIERVRVEERRLETGMVDTGAGNNEGPGVAEPFVVDQWWAVQGSNL
ncbi:EAL domain-containing protein [Rhodanobacter glycinis]|uniref:EAL domain-containing protein n=1 Tax=Rhodanobacter glycinis TaxID=582702 RepID=A0A502FPZ7_9GAMM|nr:EAL domain-containing protein [Rhodanobacter glycinis]TPG10779.1 EAL domain-containing protein [Rhodanobacter glycinis]TPG51481.1 EAL domain-containing protein [Rhodanobacter glycinis]